MTSLGGLFPATLTRPIVENALKPGCVLRLEATFPNKIKPKFFVLVATDDPEYFSFLINSSINQFIANRPDLLRCQVSIDTNNHEFLSHDSHIACHDVFILKREDVIKSLLADPSAIKGNISADIREQIKSAVKIAKTIDKYKKNRIISALESLD